MAATAEARSATPARRAPARRTAPARRRPRRQAGSQRRRGNTPITGFVPVAVGAVGGLADSGVVVRLTRGRLWIGLLGGLLVGIVALNVLALNFSASSSDAARQAEEVQRQNSALRGQLATMLSSSEVQATASELGLVVPEPGSIRYLKPSPEDAAAAAKRLRSGELSGSAVAPAPVAPVPVAPAEAAVEPDPAAVAPVAPAEAEAAVPPAEVAPVPAEAAAAPVVPADGGGVAAP